MVAALRAATAAEPLVACKPAPALMQDALARGQFRSPLVVGDRLDTDIAGANAAGLPSLMVLTGVSTAADAVTADADHRPTYLGEDLRALDAEPAELLMSSHPAWRIEISPEAFIVTASGSDHGADHLSVVRATARAALQRWALLGPAID